MTFSCFVSSRDHWRARGGAAFHPHSLTVKLFLAKLQCFLRSTYEHNRLFCYPAPDCLISPPLSQLLYPSTRNRGNLAAGLYLNLPGRFAEVPAGAEGIIIELLLLSYRPLLQILAASAFTWEPVTPRPSEARVRRSAPPRPRTNTHHSDLSCSSNLRFLCSESC